MLAIIDGDALTRVVGGANNDTVVQTPDKTINKSQPDDAYVRDFVHKACVDTTRDLFNRKDRDPAAAAKCEADFYRQNPQVLNPGG